MHMSAFGGKRTLLDVLVLPSRGGHKQLFHPHYLRFSDIIVIGFQERNEGSYVGIITVQSAIRGHQ